LVVPPVLLAQVTGVLKLGNISRAGTKIHADAAKSAAVTAVRYLRRDPAGRYTALEARSATAEALDLLPHPEGGWYR